MQKPVLQVEGLSMDFGGIRAMCELDLDVHQGQIVALIGPNGAGKTTFFNCVTGIYNPTEGNVFLNPPDGSRPIRLNGLKPNQVTKRGWPVPSRTSVCFRR